MSDITAQDAYDELKYAVEQNILKGSNFVLSLINQFETKGGLSSSQIHWAQKLVSEAEENKTEDYLFVNITSLFDGVELARPKLTFGIEGKFKMQISQAPQHGRNPNYLYIKADDQYMGKISPAGVIAIGNSPKAKDLISVLREMNNDPKTYILKYGKTSGRCACCYKALTDERSILAGVGPVCAKRWNIQWG